MRARTHCWLVTPAALADEQVRRTVVELVRARAAQMGVTDGRVRFFRGEPSPRDFIENRPAPLFVQVVQRG